MNHRLDNALRCWALIGAGLLAGNALLAAAAPESAPAPVGPVHPALGVAIPQSIFASDPTVGRDPFFPGSTRRAPVIAKTEKSVSATADRSSLLTLLGVSGPAEKRIALINNGTFIAGEEGTVRTTSGAVKIRVLEVLEKSAIVVIDGDHGRRTLRVRETDSKAIQIQTSKVENN